MAFVNEIIPEDFRDSFDFSIFKDFNGEPFRFGPWARPRWTIDRLRNAFLLFVGANDESDRDVRHECLAFWWDDEIAYFRGDVLLEVHSNRKTLTWKNVHITLPISLGDRRNSYLSLLMDAVNRKGWLYDCETLTAPVKVEISKIIYSGAES